jgi:hypothetical protein
MLWADVNGQVAWVYTLAMATLMGLLVGLTQRLLGSPGDLPEVVHHIHTSGRIPIKQAPSMFVCSAFSIAAGAFSFFFLSSVHFSFPPGMYCQRLLQRLSSKRPPCLSAQPSA